MPKIAYLDESGTASLLLSKSSVSNFFIVAAILIDEDDHDEFLIEVEKLRVKHFQTAEIKSSTVKAKDNHKRRKRILRDVSSLNFKLYALVVDKSAIDSDSGLRFKQSFIKYINGKIYRALFQHFAEISLIADEHGDKEFIQSLESFVRNNHIPDLFTNSNFKTGKSHDYLGIQLADFLAGTIAQVYESKADEELKEACLRLFKEKALSIDEWPRRYATSLGPSSINPTVDSVIKEFASNQARIYLDENIDKTDFETKLKICLLNYLLFRHEWIEDDRYVSSVELIKHLYESGYGTISLPTIRTNIVAKLRDDGVLIASSNNGYKIPSTLTNMNDFANRVDSQVVPLLKRLQLAKKSIYVATSGEVDILEHDSYRVLARLIEHLD